jgi:hypothetical protein
VTTVHLIFGVIVLVTTLAAGAWGGVAWLRSSPSVGFWYALRVAQVAVVIQVSLGAVLLLGGYASPNLHYVYGGLCLLVSLFAELVRAGAARQELGELDFASVPPDQQQAIGLAIVRREMGVMAVGCLVIFGLALRAALLSPAA